MAIQHATPWVRDLPDLRDDFARHKGATPRLGVRKAGTSLAPTRALAGNFAAGLVTLALVLLPHAVLAAADCTLEQLTDSVGISYGESAISGSGTHVAFSSDGDLVPDGNPQRTFQLFLLDTTLGTLSQLSSRTDFHHGLPALDADGSCVLFTSFTLTSLPQLFLFDAVTGDVRQISATATGGFSSTIDDTGTRVAYFSRRLIFLLDLIDNSTTQITDSAGLFAVFPDRPRISPDGAHVLFSHSADLVGENPDRNLEVFLFDAEQGELIQLTHSVSAFNISGGLSEGGAYAVFESNADLLPGENSDGGFEVFRFERATGSLQQVTDTPVFRHSRSPRISKDGEKIAFASSGDLVTGQNTDGNFELFILDLDSSELTQATDSFSGQQFTLDINSDATRAVFSNTINPVSGGNSDRSFEVFLVTCSFALEVKIDIRPGSDPNSVNLRSNGLIPVAILTTSTAQGEAVDFDATEVDERSVEFGPEGAGIAHDSGHLEDVDGDGDLDKVLHFRAAEAGIECGQVTASLTGETAGGRTIEASDSIRTVGCR